MGGFLFWESLFVRGGFRIASQSAFAEGFRKGKRHIWEQFVFEIQGPHAQIRNTLFVFEGSSTNEVDGPVPREGAPKISKVKKQTLIQTPTPPTPFQKITPFMSVHKPKR